MTRSATHDTEPAAHDWGRKKSIKMTLVPRRYMFRFNVTPHSASALAPALLFLAACGGSGAAHERARDGGDAISLIDGGTGRDAGSPRDAGLMDAGPCPWPGPTGSLEGDVIENVILLDCDDRPVELHDLCERRAAHLFIMAGW
jgi:hypothetical protein